MNYSSDSSSFVQPVYTVSSSSCLNHFREYFLIKSILFYENYSVKHSRYYYIFVSLNKLLLHNVNINEKLIFTDNLYIVYATSLHVLKLLVWNFIRYANILLEALAIYLFT